MAFSLPHYREPDFTGPLFSNSPRAVFEPSPSHGVAPDNFHATSNFPEYVQIETGDWRLCPGSRMDCVIVRSGAELSVREFRTLKKGELVLTGRKENGEEGVYVHADPFVTPEKPGDKFQFKTRVTRETPFSRDYDFIYDLLRYERGSGHITWVLGPAVAFDRDSRNAMIELISEGYCHAIMAGNALATHDLEASLFGTALGQDIYSKKNMPLGHYNHLELLNRMRAYGSIEEAVEKLGLEDSITGACLRRRVPMVLAGSIRDDGPMPGVIADVYEGQDRMREFARKSTTVIALATQLHSIAFGNMIPSCQVIGGTVRPVYLYIVDISEFAVDKLANRGSFQACGISTNVQDFCVNLHRALTG